MRRQNELVVFDCNGELIGKKEKMIETIGNQNNVLNKVTRSYYSLLKSTIKQENRNWSLLRYLPELYKLECNIVSDKKVGWYSKIIINCSLAYFVLESDVIPDREIDGYMDDLFLATYVLKEIRDNVSKNIILDNIIGLNVPQDAEGFLSLIYDIYTQTSELLGDKCQEILKLVGLNNFNSLNILFNQKKEPKLSRLKTKRRLLYAMVAVKIKKLKDRKRFFEHDKLVDYILRRPELSEIERCITFLGDIQIDNKSKSENTPEESDSTKIKVYSDMLNELFQDLPSDSFLRRIPDYFDLLQRIYLIVDLPWHLKFKINSCLSYFVIPEDIIPDGIGESGYVDDLYLCSFVLNNIMAENPKYILESWNKNYDFIQSLQDATNKCDKLLDYHQKLEILRLVGLLKFNELSEEYGFLIDKADIRFKVQAIENEIDDLLMILKTMYIKGGIILDKMTDKIKLPLHFRKLRDFKRLFTDKDWEDVITIIEKIEIHESGYDTSIEESMDKIRDKVILEINEELLND